jgi:hypothetical protein
MNFYQNWLHSNSGLLFLDNWFTKYKTKKTITKIDTYTHESNKKNWL